MKLTKWFCIVLVLFFEDLLKNNRHPHPLVYMRGLKFEDLTAILDFLYTGETNVFQENLEHFLALAVELKLKGLTGNAEVNDSDHNDVAQKKNKQQILMEEGYFPTGFNHQKKSPRPANTVAIIDHKVSAQLKQLDVQIESLMIPTDQVDHKGYKLWKCTACLRELAESHMKDHIEANHLEGVSHSCVICGKNSRSKNALRMHKYSKHEDSRHVKNA